MKQSIGFTGALRGFQRRSNDFKGLQSNPRAIPGVLHAVSWAFQWHYRGFQRGGSRGFRGFRGVPGVFLEVSKIQERVRYFQGVAGASQGCFKGLGRFSGVPRIFKGFYFLKWHFRGIPGEPPL